MLKLIKIVALAIIVSVGVAGCQTTENISQEDRVLRIANSADAVSLDPQKVNDGFSALVNTQMYEALVTRDSEMNIQPGLAESWESIDEFTYEFYLKEGVYFHNGELFTAHDVEFTILRALESPVASAILGEIDPEGIEIINDHTIRIRTLKPFAPILANLGHSTAFIVSEKAVQELGEDYYQNPVGTGPFTFDSWQTGDQIKLEKNENYHGELPQIAGIEFRVISEISNRLIELETNQVDMAFNISPGDIEQITNHEELTLLRRINLATTYIGFNTQLEPFNDKRVRQALNYGVDVDLIVNTILEGVGAKATGPLGTNIPLAATDLEGYEYNPEKAKELLAEAGYEDGFSATIVTDDDNTRISMVTAVAAQLREIGVELNIQTMEWAAFSEYLNEGVHEMFIMGWTSVTGDADYALYPLFHSSQFGSAGNRTFYADDRVDDLIEQAHSVFDEEQRSNYYRELQELITEEAPWLFLNEGEMLVATRVDVHGYEIRLNGQQRLHEVYFE